MAQHVSQSAVATNVLVHPNVNASLPGNVNSTLQGKKRGKYKILTAKEKRNHIFDIYKENEGKHQKSVAQYCKENDLAQQRRVIAEIWRESGMADLSERKIPFGDIVETIYMKYENRKKKTSTPALVRRSQQLTDSLLHSVALNHSILVHPAGADYSKDTPHNAVRTSDATWLVVNGTVATEVTTDDLRDPSKWFVFAPKAVTNSDNLEQHRIKRKRTLEQMEFKAKAIALTRRQDMIETTSFELLSGEGFSKEAVEKMQGVMQPLFESNFETTVEVDGEEFAVTIPMSKVVRVVHKK